MTPMLNPINDEWWTLAMVCAYLKLGRRALWDIRRDETGQFPVPIKPGGKICLFCAEEVRRWALSRRPGPSAPAAAAAHGAPDFRKADPKTARDPNYKAVPKRSAGRSQRRKAGLEDDREQKLF
jgi:predicted DNA-binding transcriptional regulator AlpA